MTRWCRLALVLALLGGLLTVPAAGQNPDGPDGPAGPVGPASPDSTAETLRGVVWTPPDRLPVARRALEEMVRRGVTAVRLAYPVKPSLLTHADTLGLRLYVDLPPAYVSAGRLQATAGARADTLERVLDDAAQHPSIHAVGLASLADTSVPSACEELRRLAGQVREREDVPLRTYYVTPFRLDADRCAGTTDLVLLDVRDAADPPTVWRSWQDAVDGPVGVGALGTWVQPDRASGLQVPHSPEWQARSLEQSLRGLLDTASAAPPVVFVYRWHGRPDTGDRAAPLSRNYGLFDADGRPRPAARVLTGFYTGRQQVFAFAAGEAPSPEWSWLILLGWLAMAVVALLFAQAPLVRRTAARYFTAHGFYRDAVREGRETLPEINAVLLLVVATAIGVVASAATRALDPLPSTTLVLEALPSGLGAAVGSALQTPSATGVGAGIGSLLLLGGWTLALSLAAREWDGLRVDQTLMLVVWACWPALPAMIVALVSAAQPPATAAVVAGGLFAAGGIVSVWVVGRVLRDYVTVSDVPGGLAMMLALASPPALVTAVALLVILRFGVSLPFLWHLVTRT